MKYDFTTIMERKGKDAMAVDALPYQNLTIREGFSLIPMWIADMNFATVPTVQQAIADRLSHPAFGYFCLRREYYDSIIQWQQNSYGATGLARSHIGYENGVLGGVISALNVFCSRGDKVLIHAPIYIGFTSCLENNGYRIVHSPLKQDGKGIWRMDFQDMERRLREEHIHAAIFCSPHNPCGRVWERWELEQAMELYKKYDVNVISDEIWSDLILEGHSHIPTQMVSEDAKMRTVALYAPSKTFNLAGLVGSYHIIYNPALHDRIKKESSLSHYNSVNLLSMYALIGAYKPEGRQWLGELCQVLSKNVDYAYSYIIQSFEGVTLAKPEGTYMLLLDCEAWCKNHRKSLDELLEAGARVGVIWQDGRPFAAPWGIRINLALPFSLVKEAMDRLKKYVFVS